MRKTHSLVFTSILVLLLIPACAAIVEQATPTPGISPADIIATGVMETLAAQPTATLPPTSTPEPTITPTVPLPTIPVISTQTAVPTLTAGAQPTPSGSSIINLVQGAGEYACQIISQEPIDWTQFKPRDGFDMHWKVKNAGTKDWSDAVQLVYVGGDKLHTYGNSYEMAEVVEPGDVVTLIVDMATPKQEGIYTTIWGLQNKKGIFCQFSLMVRVYK